MSFRKSRRFGAAHKRQHPFLRHIRKFIVFILCVFIVHALFTTLIADSVTAGSLSMLPGCEPGDRFITSPLWYGPLIPFTNQHLPGIFEPRRGDLILMVPPYQQRAALPDNFLRPIVNFFTGGKIPFSTTKHREWENDFVLRRIIALPGDTVRIRGGEAFVKPGGSPDFVSEFSLSLTSYKTTRQNLPGGWNSGAPLDGLDEEIFLGGNEYFILCDNRTGGLDSRLWGPVNENRIISKVLFRYWPFGKKN
jgi:signal peptidase I